jgi:hypothetical protein
MAQETVNDYKYGGVTIPTGGEQLREYHNHIPEMKDYPRDANGAITGTTLVTRPKKYYYGLFFLPEHYYTKTETRNLIDTHQTNYHKVLTFQINSVQQTTYNGTAAASFNVPIAGSVLGVIKSQTTGTTSGRDYVVQVDSSGNAKVNVPWVDTDTKPGTLTTTSTATIATATAEALTGAISLHKVSKTGTYSDLIGLPTIGNATLTVTQNSVSKGTFTANATAAVTIALTDTTYAAATASTLGLIKSQTTGTTSGRDYVVQVDSSGNAKVNVPWVDTDTNTTYAAATTSAAGLMSAADKTTLNGIGTTYLKLSGGTMTGAIAMGGNNITGVGNITFSSDERLKTSIRDIYLNNDILNLVPKTYYWKDTNKSQDRMTGYIAQDVQVVEPDVVHTDDQGYLSIDYVQLLIRQVYALTQKVKILEDRISKL